MKSIHLILVLITLLHLAMADLSRTYRADIKVSTSSGHYTSILDFNQQTSMMKETGTSPVSFENIYNFAQSAVYQICGQDCLDDTTERVLPAYYVDQSNDVDTGDSFNINGKFCVRWEKTDVAAAGGVEEVYVDDFNLMCRAILSNGVVVDFTAVRDIVPVSVPQNCWIGDGVGISSDCNDDCAGLCVCGSCYCPTCSDEDDSCEDFVCQEETGTCISMPKCDDGNLCTTDTCCAGVCTITPVDCDNGDACTIGTCNEATGGCTFEPIDCDDGNKCTIDSCSQGTCIHTPKSCEGSADGCVLGVCDEETGDCAGVEVKCDDAEPCQEGQCVQGECVYTDIDCSTGDLCVNGVCNDGVCEYEQVDCDDGNLCTIDSCDSVTGKCQFIERQCFSQDPCSVGSCNPQTGSCVLEPKCDDGNLCTTDTCCDGVCTTEPVDCDDGNACTVGTCNATTGSCSFEPINCDDGNKCTIDTCENGQCVHTPKNCEGSADGCVLGVCDPQTGECGVKEVKCTSPDPCKEGQCVQGECVYTDMDCSHGNLCINGFCNNGRCEYEPVNCDDGDKCTIDSCNSCTGECEYIDRDCRSADTCSEGHCDAETGSCVYEPLCGGCIEELVSTPYFLSPFEEARYSDYNMLVFGDFYTISGYIGGRLMAEGDVTVDNYFFNTLDIGTGIVASGPYAVDAQVPYAVIAGGAIRLSGRVFPCGKRSKQEALFAGESCRVSHNLRKRCEVNNTDTSAAFAAAKDYYVKLANTFASHPTNAYYEASRYCITVKSDFPDAGRYYINIDSKDFSSRACFRTEGINNNAQFIITLTGNSTYVRFIGCKTPSLPSRTVFVIEGEKNIYTSASVAGNILAPESEIQQIVGHQQGMVIVNKVRNVITKVSRTRECSFIHH